MNTGYDIQNENSDYLKTNHIDFMSACSAFKGPESLDPRSWYNIETQWATSSCVGNALTGPAEISYRNKTGKIGQFSRWYAYLMSQKYSDVIQPGYRYFGRDGGALIAGARKAAVENGLCFESTYPFPATAGNQQVYTTKITQSATDEALQFKIGSSSTIGTTQDPFAEAHTYLESGLGGILIGAPWPFNIDSNHTVTNFRNYGNQGHAWCILGYLKDKLIAANSHGKEFEDCGFFYLDRRGFNEMITTRNTVAVGLSDLTVPRGRFVDWSKESMFS